MEDLFEKFKLYFVEDIKKSKISVINWGRRSFTKDEIIEEIENNTDVGNEFIIMVVQLMLDRFLRCVIE
jgi:hypothetical protein